MNTEFSELLNIHMKNSTSDKQMMLAPM